MNPKQLKLIVISLAVLLLLWGGSALLSRGSDTITGSLAVPALSEAGVDTIAIVKATGSIVLVKQTPPAPPGWTVNGHRAVLDQVRELLQALQDTVRPELVAQDSSSFARLGVDSTAGRWLSIRGSGKPLLRLIVGARGSEYSSTYVRRPGDTHVYLWRGRLAQLMDRGVDDWRDKRIAALQPDSVAGVDVERGKDRYALKRAGKSWTVNGTPADSAAIARLLEKYHAITASGFATPQQVDSTKGRRPARRLTLRGGKGGVMLALAFDSTSTGFLVRHLAGMGGEGATVYRMGTWDVDGLTPASRSLLHAAK
jgi:hypothetical protein